VDLAVGIDAVGLKGARGVGEAADLRREFVEHARTGHGGVAVVAAAHTGEPLVRGGFDRVVAKADRADKALREINLVLEVERVAFFAGKVVTDQCVGRGRFSVALGGLEDIDTEGVGVAGAWVKLTVAVVFVFGTDEDVMLRAKEGELTVNFGVLVVVLPLGVAPFVGAGHDGRCRGERGTHVHGVAVVVAVVKLTGDAQFPVFGECVFEGRLERMVFVLNFPVGGFAVEIFTAHAVEASVDGGDATVEKVIVADVLGFEADARFFVNLPTEARRKEGALGFDVVSEAAGVFECHIKASEKRAGGVERCVGVKGRAVAIPASCAGGDPCEPLPLRAFADEVYDAARVGATKEARGGTFEDFDALNRGGVGRTVIATRGTKAVAVDGIGVEAAHVEAGHV